jgi:ATP phosphoribosyltransferase
VAVKLALPKGRLLRKTAARLQKAGWELDEYHSKSSFYRPKSKKFPELLIRVFHEKDIPIQIAMGNYDLGICCLDWIEELMMKYPSSDLVKVKDLLYGRGLLFLVAPGSGDIAKSNGLTRIVSEYPNLAEAWALKKRLSRFSVFPVWGAAEAYPPENADAALLPLQSIAELESCGMVPVSKEMNYSAFLVANRNSWESKNLDSIITSICEALVEPDSKPIDEDEILSETATSYRRDKVSPNTVRLALPDGHQQQQTVNILNKAGIIVDDYPSETGNRRPKMNIKGVSVKVVRPQDMPLQVANGNFDMAITGRDWVRDHLYQFPSSPVEELLDLKLRRVRLVAVVSKELDVDDTEGLRSYISQRDEPFRVASEYVNIADKYARDNQLGHYRIIPTWGATEGFLPEDADMLIENTETGRTIARHNLKIIQTLFESTACLIGNTASATDPAKKRVLETVVGRLRKAVE